MPPKRNRQLDNLIEEMVDNHANFIKGFGELLRRAYRLGRADERNGIAEDGEETFKKLT